MCHWHSAAEALQVFPVTKEQDWAEQLLIQEPVEMTMAHDRGRGHRGLRFHQIPNLIRFVL